MGQWTRLFSAHHLPSDDQLLSSRIAKWPLLENEAGICHSIEQARAGLSCQRLRSGHGGTTALPAVARTIRTQIDYPAQPANVGLP